MFYLLTGGAILMALFLYLIFKKTPEQLPDFDIRFAGFEAMLAAMIETPEYVSRSQFAILELKEKDGFHFLQFYHEDGKFLIDFPVFSDESRVFEPAFRETAAELGLKIVELEETGGVYLDIDVPEDTKLMARYLRTFFERVFAANETTVFEVTKDGFDHLPEGAGNLES